MRSYFEYKSTQYWIEKSTTKAIALVVKKIDYMLLQRRQIVKAVCNQIDIEDPVYAKDYHKFSFHRLDIDVYYCYHIQDCITMDVSK
jgi:hypothetical protein